jgi:hypothetical protein
MDLIKGLSLLPVCGRSKTEKKRQREKEKEEKLAQITLEKKGS